MSSTTGFGASIETQENNKRSGRKTMNLKIGAIVCAGLIWLGIQTETQAQSVNIRIGGSNRDSYSRGGLHGRRIYHQSNYDRRGVRSNYGRNVVIDSNRGQCCDCYRQSYRNRYDANRSNYYAPYGYSNNRPYYYPLQY